MFQPRFAEKVKDGSKRQTIRPVPKRGIVAGQILSLRQWSGKPYRSKQVVLREDSCASVDEISIDSSGVACLSPDPLTEEFAKADGFESWKEMVEWFRKTHGFPFRGILIKW
jgi:hypothetical protein